LSDVTLFVQDWGGPTGMHYATNHPENVDSFVVMNTVMWPMMRSLHVRAFSGAMNTPVARYLHRRYNVPVDWVMPLWFGERSKFTPAIRRQYREPLTDPDDRKGALMFTRELIGSTPFLSDLWERRGAVAGKPALLCWGMEGPLFRPEALGRWQALFPDARTVEYPTAGHFVQEEKGVEMVPDVRRFLREDGR
jgi:haloalkane dehalogenase